MIAQDPAGGSRVDRGRDGHDHGLDGPRAGGRAERDGGLARRTQTASCGGPGSTLLQRDRSVTDPAEDGIVIEQRPPPGVEVDEGSGVIIVVGRFEEPFEPPTGEPPVP